MTHHQLRWIAFAPVGTGFDELGQRLDPFLGHRMREQIGIDVAGRVQHLVREPLEGVIHALGRLPGFGEELHPGVIGLFLLGPLIRQRVRASTDWGAETAAMPSWPAPPLRLITPPTIAPTPSSMAMMAEVCARASSSRMRARWPPARCPVSWAKTPIDLVRGLGLHQRSDVDENAPSVGHEGIEAAIVDDDDLYVLLGQPRNFQDRGRVISQQLLDLSIANDRQALGRVIFGRRR